MFAKGLSKFKKNWWRAWFYPKWLSLGVIWVYQSTFSPDHGWNKRLFPNGYCPFTPSCSQYSYEAIAKHGFIIGWFKTFWRILRCNPCSKGGNDPV